MRAAFLIFLAVFSLTLAGCNQGSVVQEPGHGADEMALHFTPLEKVDEQVGELLTENVAEILQETPWTEAVFFIYSKPNDPDQGLYGGVRIGQKQYQFGQIGYGRNTDAITMTPVQAFGEGWMKVEGFRGANYRVTYYLGVEKEHPFVFLFVDGGSRYEGELEGEQVIIGSYGLTATFFSSIYKREGNTIVYADLNQQISADSVRFTDAHEWEIRSQPNTEDRIYTYRKGRLVPDH
ncbi:hypothetical protein NDK47_14170 [Brevibacillus ruminantium]|uniref:Lipoprotein n=1 Tax=Brevibacillus ruminantium TaxID=2950604 RepID=A0ABY4WBM7_9BACL|nr:hypothetical protein [Brevibacillus ruminantium]USG63332.1 hypothetical protein NDK47_14170 [Brevibacillus ruminantium]